jgi:orotate phosphoribosyltransferase
VDRALLAQQCGLDGAIASPQEVRQLRAVLRPDFFLVTPGVRPAGTAVNDQSRVATPFEAIRDGADFLVVGRPIHGATDPARAAQELVREIQRGWRQRREGKADAGAPQDSAPGTAQDTAQGVVQDTAQGVVQDAAPGAAQDTVQGVAQDTVQEVMAARLLGMLRQSGAFLEGHFILTSGLHSDRYVQCAQLLQYPEKARRAGVWLAARLRPYRPDVVLSPALGGVVIGQEVAAALGVRSLFAERDATGALQMRRGFSLGAGERVAIVDDVCTRGGSIAECARVVQSQGGTTVVTGAIIDRSGGERAFQLPFESLLTVQAKAQRPEECPLCAAGSPAVKPGSRRS